MKIAKVRIRNFRCLKDVEVDLDDTTVILGANNSGKSAFIDVFRYVLGSSARRSQVFAEYDFHMPCDDTDPRNCDPIIFDFLLSESSPQEWDAEIMQRLNPVIQQDLFRDLCSIHLRVSVAYNEDTRRFETDYKFLTFAGTELPPSSQSNQMLNQFLKYIPVFHLSALRDATEQFSPNSQWWGRILKSIDIPEERKSEIERSLEALNHDLLHSDGRLESVTNNLQNIQQVMQSLGETNVSIRALPLRLWDLMSKSEILLQGQGSDTRFPLARHGHGVQSLAVMFLFQAFVDQLLAAEFENESSPVLALEEPEAHLHPQAAKSVWKQIESLPGQKIITSHSPHFAQQVPFSQLRIFRRNGCGSAVFSIPRSFRAVVPHNTELQGLVDNSGGKYCYLHRDSILEVSGEISEREYRQLAGCYTDRETRDGIHQVLRQLQRVSLTHIPEDELAKAETFARRVRGEIFFAHAWILCEGQSDYLYLHRFAEMKGSPLESHGISVIDHQNSGSAKLFACLARALGFSWFMMADGDSGGASSLASLRSSGFSDDELNQRVVQLPSGEAIELHLLRNGFIEDTHRLAQARGFCMNGGGDSLETALAQWMTANKLTIAMDLTDHLLETSSGSDRVPPLCSEVLDRALSECGGASHE